MIKENEMNNQEEEDDWETASEKRSRIRNDTVDNLLTLMIREPSMTVFKENLNLSDLVATSCTYKKTSNVIRDLFPQIEELHNTFDFNRVFNCIKRSDLVRECILHFRPNSVIISSTLTCNLPTDLLQAFTLISPYELTIQIKGINQQFLVSSYPLDIGKLRFECSNKYGKTTRPLNSLLQSMTKIESLDLFYCGIDDFTGTAIGKLCLQDLILSDVRIDCAEIDILVRYLSRQTFMTNLKLRYFKKFQYKERLFFGKLMRKIKNMSIKYLEVSVNNDFFEINDIISTPSLNKVRINFDTTSSTNIFNYIKNVIVTRSEVHFEIFRFRASVNAPRFFPYNVQNDNGKLIGTLFDDFKNVISINF